MESKLEKLKDEMTDMNFSCTAERTSLQEQIKSNNKAHSTLKNQIKDTRKKASCGSFEVGYAMMPLANYKWPHSNKQHILYY